MTSKTILSLEGGIVNGIGGAQRAPILFDPFFGLNWNFSSLSSFANSKKMFHDIPSRVFGIIPLVGKREPEGGRGPGRLRRPRPPGSALWVPVPGAFGAPALAPLFMLLYANSNIKGLQTKSYSFLSIARLGSFKTLLVRSLIFFITFSLLGFFVEFGSAA